MTTAPYWPEVIPRHLEYPRASVGALLAAACRRHGPLTALEDGDSETTYAELLAEASAFAHALRADGAGLGATVLLHLPNSRWFVVAYAGAQLAGAVVSPANPLHPVEGLRHQIAESGAVVVVTQPDGLDAVLAAREGTGVRRVVVIPGGGSPADLQVSDWEAFTAGQPVTPPAPAAVPDDVAHLAFTGGTTGVSKGVRVLQRNVMANVCHAVAWRTGSAVRMTEGGLVLEPFDGADTADFAMQEGRGVTVVAGPLYHAHALINTLFMLTAGARIVIMRRFSAERMLELIESRRATYITGSPAMWHALLGCPGGEGRDLTSLRTVSSGAAPIDSETLRGLRALFPSAMVTEGYGLTEGTCLVTATPGFAAARRKTGSVGQPVPDTEVEIRGPDGAVLPAGETGEIWVRGPQVTGGYAGHDELTAAQFTADGWLRTGDVGHIDDEGFVFVSDRLKDMLLYKGYNVYPRELEEVLVRHPAVDAAAVVGRDERGVGQVPVAFVVPAAGADPHPGELTDYVAARVLPYKKIREVHLVESLPASAAGKILKTELRARLT